MKIHAKQNNINFNAGLSPVMKREIADCDVKKISDTLMKAGIQSDFKNNKFIAWCSLKTVEIIKYLNSVYGLKLSLPKSIIVEDFNRMNIGRKDSYGFYNACPSQLYSNNNGLISENTIFFNSFQNYQTENKNSVWDDFNLLSDLGYFQNLSCTNFFLEIFLHEFAHGIHLNNIIEKRGRQNFNSELKKIFSPLYLEKFRTKYDSVLKKELCSYASLNPIETVACDFSKRIIKSLDKNSLLPQYNFIDKSPYRRRTPGDIFKKEKNMEKTLRNFWNGKFNV